MNSIGTCLPVSNKRKKKKKKKNDNGKGREGRERVGKKVK
jgi:hypothetical protein